MRSARHCSAIFAAASMIAAASHSAAGEDTGAINRSPPPGPATVEALSGTDDTEIVRAVVRAYEIASIGSLLNAPITYLPAREGDRFKAGDIILTFDCRHLKAEIDAASAAAAAAEATWRKESRLLEYKSTGEAAVEQAFHALEKAKAEARVLAVRLEGCVVKAPFDGRVVEKSAQVHELSEPNKVLMKIINDTKLELVLMVPSSWMARLPAGTRFSVRLDETGETVPARIVQSTGLIDPVSQSARLIADLEGPVTNVAPGMSGTAIFEHSRAEP